MKHEWRKKEKEYYIPKNKPEKKQIEKFKFIMIKGEGSPDSEGFKNAIEILYSLSYAIKMMPKKGITPEGYYDYVVYPLEGIWDLDEEGRKKEELDRNHLVYNIMIRQPEFVTEEVFNTALNTVKEKKDNLLLDRVVFDSIEEGLVVQMLHIGPFETEKETFDVMKQFCEDNNLEIKDLAHREIYLSDFRKVAKEKLKTTLRYRVREVE